MASWEPEGPRVGLVGPPAFLSRAREVLRERSGVVLESPTVTDLVDAGRREHVPAAVVAVSCSASLTEQVATLRSFDGDRPRCVLVVPSARGMALRRLLQAGVDGVILEPDLERALEVSLEAAMAGQLAVPRSLYGEFTRAPLSSREKQVLSLVVLGFSNAEIAGKLWLTESTVKSHLSSAFAKLGVRSRNEATSLILDADAGLGTGILTITGSETRRGARSGTANR